MSLREQDRKLWRMPLGTYALALVLAIAALVMVFLGSFLHGRSEQRYAPAMHTLAYGRLQLSEAHTGLEELLAGDTSVTADTVWARFRLAERSIQSLLDGSTCPHGMEVVSIDEESAAIRNMLEKLAAFEEMAHRRIESGREHGVAGSVQDQEIDAQYALFRGAARRVEQKIMLDYRTAQKTLSRIQLMLFFAAGSVSVLMGLVIAGSEVRRKKHFLEFQRMVQELDASNQQMTATNQQLRAQEQQLRAANQQLHATEQQLRAANQQLVANEEELRQSQERLQSLYDTMTEGVVLHEMVYDETGMAVDYVITMVNPAFERMTGLSGGEACGRKATELYGTDTPPYLEEYAKVASDRVPITFETYFPPMNKHFHISAISPKKGTFATIFLDITKEKEHERVLRESEARYRALFEGSADGIVITESETGRFVYVNKSLQGMFGYTEEEMLSRDVTAFHPEADLPEVLEHFKEHVAGRKTESHEIPCLKKDGTEFLCTIATSKFTVNGQNYVASFFRDITEKKRMAEEITKAQRLDSLGVLAGGIAHDFNNLLAGVFGYIDLARQYGEMSEQSEQYLEKAIGAYTRARDLTRQLLTFSRGGDPVKTPGAIDSVVREASELALSGSDTNARFRLDPKIWAVAFDEGQMSQVVNNIVLNARQAMPSGGVIDIEVKNLHVDGDDGPVPSGPYVSIAISDRGIGIPDDYLQKIFDPFFSTKQQGSGLGLAVSYSIMKKHGGHIEVESETGRGTTFTLLLPAVESEKGAGGSPMHHSIVHGRGNVLVMDDEDVVRELAGDMLAKLGYSAVTCIDGTRALELYEEEMDAGTPFDAVILDLTIPGGMGGVETLEHLKKLNPDVQAIVSSGYSDNPVVANYRDHGFGASVSKPYRIAELSRALAEVIQGNKS